MNIITTPINVDGHIVGHVVYAQYTTTRTYIKSFDNHVEALIFASECAAKLKQESS